MEASDLEPYRARVTEARERYEKVLKDREERGDGEQPSAAPTSFHDCASLYDQAALNHHVAEASASGEIIEV